ncbi:MAG: PaaI family thioesterase [Halioglobus sp.]|nr:PaaI family thioesterase [Halioglobus sp.]
MDTRQAQPRPQSLKHATGPHPFAELIGLEIDGHSPDACDCSVLVKPELLNPHGVVHGAVLYALADTGMGGAIAPGLDEGQLCATVEIKFNYYKAVQAGWISCRSTVLNRGKRFANLESRLYVDDALVATANGTFAIFTPTQG